MIVNLPKLKGKMVECEISQDVMAKRMKINRSTFIRKMSGGGLGFTVGEITKMIDILKLTKEDIIAIFFVDKVA